MGNNSFCLIQMIACVFFAYQIEAYDLVFFIAYEIEAYDLLICIDNLSFRFKQHKA